MRCYICNRVIEDPHYNQDHQDYDPCDTCKAIIDDLLASYGDQPSAPDDEVSSDPILEGLYPTIYDPFNGDEESP